MWLDLWEKKLQKGPIKLGLRKQSSQDRLDKLLQSPAFHRIHQRHRERPSSLSFTLAYCLRTVDGDLEKERLGPSAASYDKFLAQQLNFHSGPIGFSSCVMCFALNEACFLGFEWHRIDLITKTSSSAKPAVQQNHHLSTSTRVGFERNLNHQPFRAWKSFGWTPFLQNISYLSIV